MAKRGHTFWYCCCLVLSDRVCCNTAYTIYPETSSRCSKRFSFLVLGNREWMLCCAIDDRILDSLFSKWHKKYIVYTYICIAASNGSETIKVSGRYGTRKTSLLNIHTCTVECANAISVLCMFFNKMGFAVGGWALFLMPQSIDEGGWGEGGVAGIYELRDEVVLIVTEKRWVIRARSIEW